MTTDRRNFLKKMARAAAGVGLWPGRRVPRPAWPPPSGLDDDAFWALVRRQYPLTLARTYLNTGGLGPAPYPVLDAVQRTTAELQAVSETGHGKIEDAREPVAAFFGAKPSEIAFMRNATEGNATVASGLDLRPGDEVVFESHAHPGGSIPWLNRQKQHGVKVKVFEPDPTSAAGNLERIAALLTPRTRVLQVSHVTAPTGLRFPVAAIAELARDRDLWFHIDGAQSAGMIPIDLHALGCDSYATSGHKWMGAPHGTGLLYIREARLDEVMPTDIGAYSDASYHLPDLLEYYPTARRYECGTRDAAQVVGLAVAVDFLSHIGMARVAAYGQGLALYLQERLRALPGVTVLTPADPALSAAMTTLRVDGFSYDRLNSFYAREYQLRCRVVTEQDLNAVRISTHMFNNREDCDRVVEATVRAIEQGG